MAKDYIERKTVVKRLKTVSMPDDPYSKGIQRGVEYAVEVITEAPAADVVEVVRCKDCMYQREAKVNAKGFLICPASGMEITDMDYCSYGERRDGDGL